MTLVLGQEKLTCSWKVHSLQCTSTGADIADFTELSSESVGQLYAYRYSNTSVVLGTRSASGLIGDSNEVVQMAIGLSAVADGMYVCVAENFPHRNNSGTSSITVNIQAITCEWQINYKKCIHFIRAQHALLETS